jgi:predicted DNA-binding transcriptional regulator YafY
MDVRPVLSPVSFSPGEAAALIASLVAVGPYASATARTALDKLLAMFAGLRRGSWVSRDANQRGVTAKAAAPERNKSYVMGRSEFTGLSGRGTPRPKGTQHILPSSG